ncbi:hypothetical protein EB796_011031 [Bugula neritina]|uniref:Uncharacterized protein n=1 Tax=Bugula neritina TaxID=10212 RepID=A0A7J7JY17_BUGNE|nr:hypothetical protein EB796_011031 [Bugula neritina]
MNNMFELLGEGDDEDEDPLILPNVDAATLDKVIQCIFEISPVIGGGSCNFAIVIVPFEQKRRERHGSLSIYKAVLVNSNREFFISKVKQTMII